MKTKITLLCLFLIIGISSYAQNFSKQGAGVTLITHGWDPSGNAPKWIDSMANAIIDRSGTNAEYGTITITGVQGALTATCSNWNFNLATKNSGEIIIKINWSAVANHLNTRVTAQEVAAAVAPKIYTSQNGQPPLSELPIHLIGHSRGGGMVFEIARLLGLQGIEVEQITALDPHPLTTADPQSIPQTIDATIKIYENVLFVDNYWQNIEFPKGQYLTGAYNRLWPSMPGGYHNESGYTYNILGTNYNFSDHLNIILMYHGTIDTATPTYNGEATMTSTERNNWFNTYENLGLNAGYKYSRNIMGNRKSTDAPVSGGDQIIAGYHNNAILGGNGPRDGLTWASAVWPNIIAVSISRSGTPINAGQQTLTSGEVLQLNYIYRSYANASTVSFFIDIDRNPYNNNNADTIITINHSATGNAITQNSSAWNVPALNPVNEYYLCAMISDGIRKRFIYADYEFTINNVILPAITVHPQNQINICPDAIAQFSVEGNNILDYQWQESADNGTSWFNLSDNAIYSGSDTTLLIINVGLNLNNYYYRCIVANTDGADTSNIATLITDTMVPQAIEPNLPEIFSACEVTSLIAPKAIDNCSDTVIATYNITLPITASTLITWTYDDGNGNISAQTQQVIINDTIAPVPDNLALDTLFAQCSINSLTVPTATDNCSGSITGAQNIPLPITASITLIWTFTDANNNISYQNQIVIINDTIPPVPDSVSLSDIYAECALDTLAAPTATDNCSGIVVATHNSALPITTNTIVMWTYTDDNGNFINQQQQIFIYDNTPPVPNTAILDTIFAQCSTTITTFPTATDNCAGSITATTSQPLSYFNQGVYTITWNYDDGNGNLSNQSQVVKIEDYILPTITCVENQNINLTQGQTYYTVIGNEFDPLQVGDNCAIASIVNDFNASNTLADAHLPMDTTIITWTITDSAGNINTCTFQTVVNEYNGIIAFSENSLLIYPNPAHDYVKIVTHINNDYSITLQDCHGRILVLITSEQPELILDLKNFSRGVYFLKISNNNMIITRQIFKTN